MSPTTTTTTAEKHCRTNNWRLFEGDHVDAGGTHRYARLRCATPSCKGRLLWVRRTREP